jgi:hypothetical protein
VIRSRSGDIFKPATLRSHEQAMRLQALPERITPHPCRHTFVSFMIAAGVNAKALQTFLGPASITETYDRYGHLMPGSEAEAAELLDGYLGGQVERGEEQGRTPRRFDRGRSCMSRTWLANRLANGTAANSELGLSKP